MGEKDEPIWDIFNYGALQIFGALENKTPEQVANDLLEQEKEMRDNKLKEKEDKMPIKRVKGGWKYGQTGKVYKSKAGAVKQARAIIISQKKAGKKVK